MIVITVRLDVTHHSVSSGTNFDNFSIDTYLRANQLTRRKYDLFLNRTQFVPFRGRPMTGRFSVFPVSRYRCQMRAADDLLIPNKRPASRTDAPALTAPMNLFLVAES